MTILADDVLTVNSEEHLINQRFVDCVFQRRLNRLKQDTVQLLDVLLLLGIVSLPTK